MVSSVNTKISFMLLIAVMALSVTGAADIGLCGCEFAPRDYEMPSISEPGCCTSCCDRAEHSEGCCCTLKDWDAEPRADGFLPRPNLNDDRAPATHSLPGNKPRIATGKNRCIEPAFTIERLPLHLCTTVLLI